MNFVEFCARFFDVTVSALTGPRRFRAIAQKRMVCICAAREVLSLSILDAAQLFGRRDHGSYIHARNRVESSPQLKGTLLDLQAAWQNKVHKTAAPVDTPARA